MTTYKEIFGKYVKNYSSDPSSDAEGQIWYNTTSGTFKSVLSSGTWSSASPLILARGGMGEAGTQNATVVFGGNGPAVGPPTHTNATEEYNGSGWATSGNMATGRRMMMSFGTQTAAVGAAGYTNTPSASFPMATELYNGTSWTAGNNVNSPPGDVLAGAGVGTQTAGLGFGGYVQTTARYYDGTNWTFVSSMNTARGYLGGVGTQTAALGFGGSGGGPIGRTNAESWNGTSWTTVNSLNTGRRNLGAAGNQTSALAFGGATNTPTIVAVTESWDGTSWTTLPATMATTRAALSGTGTQTTALGAGGYTTAPGSSNATEEWNVASTIITGAAWASGGSMNTGRYSMGSAKSGTQNANLVWGGTTPSPPYGTTATESYNGTTWTNLPATYPITTDSMAGLGSQTAALGAGGAIYPNVSNNSSGFNGTTWTTLGNINTARRNLTGIGLQTAALIMGGFTPPSTYQTATESYNGSTWTSVNSMNTSRTDAGSAGTQTSGLIFGGTSPTAPLGKATESWNGTSWTTTPYTILGNSPYSQCGFGTQTAAISAGGRPSTNSNMTQYYDGTGWITYPSLAAGRWDLEGGGTAASGLVMGGSSPSTATEEFNGETTAANTKTITTS